MLIGVRRTQASMSADSSDETKMRQHRSLLISAAELLSVPDEEEEFQRIDDESTLIDTSVPVRPWSDFSLTSVSVAKEQAPTPSTPSSLSQSRSYRFVELERAFTSAKLLETFADRIRFHQEYLQSIRENAFDAFLREYHEKLDEHHAKIKHERLERQTRTFTFVDLEERFLSRDPTREIKIVFLDDPTGITKIRSTALMYQNARSSKLTEGADIEGFYSNESHRLICDSPRARDEITLFARRAAERLQDHLPHLPRVPHLVTLVDERDKTGKPDERMILQSRHKEALSAIHQRRQLLTTMITQSKKNQLRMEQESPRLRRTIDHSTGSRDLLEQANRIGRTSKVTARRLFPTELRLRTRAVSKFGSSSQSTMVSASTTQSFSSSSTPFTEALPFYPLERKMNLLPGRPLTAPMKQFTNPTRVSSKMPFVYLGSD